MSEFVSKWLAWPSVSSVSSVSSIPLDESTDKPTSVSSVSESLAHIDADAGLARASTQGIALEDSLSFSAGKTDAEQEETQEKQTDKTDRTHIPLVPSRCLGPQVCAVVGICGRMSCIPTDEALDWMAALTAARLPTNPHRVPDFDSAWDMTTDKTDERGAA